MVRRSFILRGVLWICLTAVVCCTCALASETITGVILNKTTGKPAASDDVALLTIDHGALEVSRGKTAEDGSFRLRTNVSGKHVLRVRHEGVIYQQEAAAGVAQQIEVFDSSANLAGVLGAVTIMKVESSGQVLHVTELHSIANESKPPRTLANARNLEILLPPKATLDSVVVQGPSWRAEKVQPRPVAIGSQQYAVGYPLRPGTTQFAVKYHLPYQDKAVIRPRLQYPTKLWTVMFPKSMSFRALQETSFHAFMDQDGMRVQAITKAAAGEVPGFVISGAGSFPERPTPASAKAIPAELLRPSHFQMKNRVAIPARPAFMTGTRRTLLFAGLIGIALLLGIGFVNRARFSWLRLRSSAE